LSDYETHKGTLKPTKYTKESLVKEYFNSYKGTNKYILTDKELIINDELTDDIIDEYFLDTINEYIELNGIVYKISDTELNDDDIYEMSKKEDGTLEYIVKFYNGGCGFEEALDTAYSTLK
jgi:translation initiation factor 2 beta subunit (eIF-2beta)/eIF-5